MFRLFISSSFQSLSLQKLKEDLKEALKKDIDSGEYSYQINGAIGEVSACIDAAQDKETALQMAIGLYNNIACRDNLKFKEALEINFSKSLSKAARINRARLLIH